MRKLEVGDKIVLIKGIIWPCISYSFETVKSVTEKYANTNRQTKLNREPIDCGKGSVYKSINEGKKQHWQLLTDEISKQYLNDKEAEKERNKIETWWRNFRPDEEAVANIYYMFNPKQ